MIVEAIIAAIGAGLLVLASWPSRPARLSPTRELTSSDIANVYRRGRK